MTIYQDWIDAKRELSEAQERLDAISAKIAMTVDVKDEVSKTTKVEGYKVTTTQPIYRGLTLQHGIRFRIASRPTCIR